MQEFVHNLHGQFVKERPNDKYHYTNITGLEGILKNCSLWLMDSGGLNDRSEGCLILKNSKNKLKEKNCDLLQKYETIMMHNLENFFSCSFSSSGNLLSQWRGYGDIAIGFDWEILNNQTPRIIFDSNGEHPTTSGIDFTKCIYIDPSIETDIDSYVNKVVDQISKTFNKSDPAIQAIQYCALKIGTITTSIKHIGFFEENEYRIVHYWWDCDGIKVINSNRSRIEYKFNVESIKSIIIGPCENQEEKVCSVKELLETLGKKYNNIEIYCSKIPFIKKKPYRDRDAHR